MWVVGVCVVIGGAFGLYTTLNRDTNPIPVALRTSLEFSPLVIPTTVNTIITSDYKYSPTENPDVSVLSFILQTQDQSITVSEYVQSPEFTDIPEYKNQFLTNVIQQYDTVQTANGTIYLGRLEKQSNEQLAVMLENGLVIFMKPDSDIDATLWRRIGDQLVVQKSSD